MGGRSTEKEDRLFLSRVEETIRRHHMLPRGQRVLLGVSGGADSVCLFLTLSLLGERRGWDLGIAHLDHGLRGEEGKADAAFVRAMARRHRVPFHTESTDVAAHRQGLHLSLEEAARQARYEFLERTARNHGFARIAVGHHADDNAELVLMNLLRGAGTRGLAGIPPVRGGWIVRPLLEVRRTEIIAFLNRRGEAWVEDPSNQSLTFRRNRIRHQLLPLLEGSYNPNLVLALNRLAALMRDEEAFWGERVGASLADCLLEERPEETILLKASFNRNHPAVRRRILRGVLSRVKGDLRRVGMEHVEQILRLAEKEGARREVHLPGELVCLVEDDRLVVRRDSGKRKGERTLRTLRGWSPVVIDGPGTYTVPEIAMGLELSAVDPSEVSSTGSADRTEAYFDRSRLQFPLTLRQVLPGDRFTPMGAGGSQKVKKYFIDHKVPRGRRTLTPVLESGGNIVWLVGHRPDDSVKVTPDTRCVVRGKVFLA